MDVGSGGHGLFQGTTPTFRHSPGGS